MRLELSADQEFFRDTTAKFLEDQAPVAELRRLRDDADGFTEKYWRQGADLGWTSLLVRERDGGGAISGEGVIDLTLIAHEFGRHAAPGPLLTTNIVAAALSDTGGRHAEVLAALLTGAVVATWCYEEGTSLGRTELEIRPDGADVVVTGSKRPVEAAAQSQHFLVTGRTGNGLTQVLVPADAPGVHVRLMSTVDLTRRFGVVEFDGVRVSADAVVGDIGAAADQVDRQLQLALVISAAETVGALQTVFDMTVEWAGHRYSFGRPLASYQALKHRFADMKTWLEASHAISDAAATAVQAASADAGMLASAAKAYVGQYGSELLHDCVQLHGGIGVTFEHDLHLYLRRGTLNRALYGAPAEHRQRLATAVEEGKDGW